MKKLLFFKTKRNKIKTKCFKSIDDLEKTLVFTKLSNFPKILLNTILKNYLFKKNLTEGLFSRNTKEIDEKIIIIWRT